MISSRSRQFLPPLLAGLLLAGAGWSGATSSQAQAGDFQSQLVVRPVSAKLASSGESPKADGHLAGRFSFQQAGFRLELEPKGWPNSKAEIAEARGMTTFRAQPPRSWLTVSIKGDRDAKAKLLELPKKTKLALEKSAASLEPGRHELLVQADGYVPKRLSVNLKPGERREVAVGLEAIPGLPPSIAIPGALPAGGLPSLPAGFATSGVDRPPTAYVAPLPVHRAPAYQAPVVRFTPVAPATQPVPAAPVPMFTPIGNPP